MRNRSVTPEQKAKSAERRERFRAIVKQERSNSTYMNTNYTPGPWKVSEGPNLQGIDEVFVTDGDDFVCSCGTVKSTMPGGMDRIRANARLIAAAPSLWETIKDVEAILCSDFPDNLEVCQSIIRKCKNRIN